MKIPIPDQEARFEYELLVFENEVHEAMWCFYIWRTLKKPPKSQRLFHQLNRNAHGTVKCCIFNPLLVRQIQSIGEHWFFDVSLQPRPARKSIFAGDCKLRVTEAESGVEDFSVCGQTEAWVKFPEPLGYFESSGGALS
jgi:hypothetical protein